jgi:NADPH:quinone reductase-like Zn-dependent oxidoreductase
VVLAFWEGWHDGAFQAAEAGAPLGGPRDGVLAEHVVASEERVVVVPDALSDAEAASLPCAASTAWNALVSSGHIRPGQSVLVQGTGGVSLFALQFARMAGAQVIVTSSSDGKLGRARELGALAGVNYRNHPRWAGQVLALTGGQGVDHVIEVGGPGSFTESLKAIRPGGQINVIGYLGGVDGAINPLDIFRRQATVRGIPVGSRAMLGELMAALAAGTTRPVIDRVKKLLAP